MEASNEKLQKFTKSGIKIKMFINMIHMKQKYSYENIQLE